jgi:hypothetical protein
MKYSLRSLHVTRNNQMKQLAPAALWLAGIVGLLLFIWFDFAASQQRFLLHMGRPWPWLTIDQAEQAFRSEMQPLTLSFAAGLVGIAAIITAWRLGLRNSSAPAPNPPKD